MKEETFTQKICLLGDSAVGKTSLVRRFVYNVFTFDYKSTIGTHITTKELILPSPKLQAQVKLAMVIWDIEGLYTFRNIHAAYIQGARGALMVCDLTRRATMENLTYWISRYQTIAGRNMPFVVVANKSDLRELRAFHIEDADALAKSYNMPLIVTSAKTGEGVENAFYRLGELMLQKI